MKTIIPPTDFSTTQIDLLIVVPKKHSPIRKLIIREANGIACPCSGYGNPSLSNQDQRTN